MDKHCASETCNICKSPSTCTLNTLGIGCRGNVVTVGGDPEIRRRLLEMGFCNGASVEVVRRAPLGDPIEFRLRGYYLSLRGEQAKHVNIVQA
jgi:ferrous iron transport protein A